MDLRGARLGLLLLGLTLPACAVEPVALDAGLLYAQGLLLGARKTAASAVPPAEGLTSAEVCGADPAATQAAREKRLADALRALEPELRPRFAAIAERYGLPAPSGDDYLHETPSAITYTFPYQTAKAKEALSAFSEAVEEAVLRRVRMPDYERVRSALIARIEASALSADAKAALVHRVRITKMVLPSQYIRDYATTGGELWAVIPLLAADQAWNASYEDLGGAAVPELTPDMSVVIVYPGLLLAEDHGDGAAHIEYVLAHETAHSIDSGRFPGLYGAYTDCMKTRHGVGFKAWDEVLADQWAADALSALEPALPRAERAARASRSFEIICGSTGEGADAIMGRLVEAEHPSGRYRIEKILGVPPAQSCSL